MDNGYTKRIRERVLSLEDGTVFVTSDFADIADTSTIRQSLSRLVRKRLIFRYDRKNPRLLFSSRSTLTVHI